MGNFFNFLIDTALKKILEQWKYALAIAYQIVWYFACKKRPKSGHFNEKEMFGGFLVFIILKFILELEAEDLCSEKNKKTLGRRVITVIKQLASLCASTVKLLSLHCLPVSLVISCLRSEPRCPI